MTFDPADSNFNRLIGFEIADWREDYAELNLTVAEHHLNRSGVPHGGVLATLIDAAGGLAGCFCREPGRVRQALTLSMTVNYAGQAGHGQLRVVGRRRGGGRRIFFASVEIFDDADNVVALGEGTYRYRRGSEDPAGVTLEQDQ